MKLLKNQSKYGGKNVVFRGFNYIINSLVLMS
jgi:hypothetical protein